ncbi:MAG: hypothetical protein ACXWLH_06010 [Candidatus Saccharimonadales bacterium]
MGKRRLIFTAVATGVLLLLAAAYALIASNGSSKREIKSFNPNGVCQSITNPECGYCPGSVTDGKCYVKKGTFSQYD